MWTIPNQTKTHPPTSLMQLHMSGQASTKHSPASLCIKMSPDTLWIAVSVEWALLWSRMLYLSKTAVKLQPFLKSVQSFKQVDDSISRISRVLTRHQWGVDYRSIQGLIHWKLRQRNTQQSIDDLMIVFCFGGLMIMHLLFAADVDFLVSSSSDLQLAPG